MNLRSILIACLAAAQGARAEPVKVACFGDSVTAGSKAKGQPWCKQIRAVLGRGFFTTYNFGKSGATVTNVSTFISSRAKHQNQKKGHESKRVSKSSSDSLAATGAAPRPLARRFLPALLGP